MQGRKLTDTYHYTYCMGFTCYCIKLRIIASFLRLTMDILFGPSIDFCQMGHGVMVDQSEEEKIA